MWGRRGLSHEWPLLKITRDVLDVVAANCRRFGKGSVVRVQYSVQYRYT